MAGNYLYEVTVPSNTSEENAIETEVDLSAGIIDQISIGFPPGCRALAHLQIKQQASVLYPSNQETSYAWDNVIFTFFPAHRLDKGNTKLILRTWNTDEFYQHTITVIINVSPFLVNEPLLEASLMIAGML